MQGRIFNNSSVHVSIRFPEFSFNVFVRSVNQILHNPTTSELSKLDSFDTVPFFLSATQHLVLHNLFCNTNLQKEPPISRKSTSHGSLHMTALEQMGI